jgi:hypothetical protein
MKLTFWVITALTAIFMSKNARYALRQYWSGGRRAIFTLYMVFLLAFGALVTKLAAQTLTFVEVSRAQDRSDNVDIY